MKLPIVKQEGMKDCGAACLSMIIQYYKGYASLEYLRELTKTTKNGTTAFHLIGAANEIGFESKGFKASLEDMKKDCIFPCIAHVTLDNTYNHFVVIYEIDYKKKILKVGDPAKGLRIVNFKEFNKIFNEIIIILYPIKNIVLEQKGKSFLSFSFEIIKKYKSMFIQIFILSLFITIFSIVTSFYFKHIYESTTSSKNLIILVFILYFIVYCFKIITDFLRNKLLIIVNQKISLSLTIDTFKNVLSLPYRYFKSRTTGEVISRINDLNTIRDVISKISVTVFVDVILATFASIILFILSKELFFISLVMVICYIFISRIFYPMFHKNILKVQQQRADINSYMTESISGFETVKGLNIESNILDKFNVKYINHLKQLVKVDNIYNNQYLLNEIVQNIGQVIIIFIGCLLLYKDSIKIGTLITFNSLLLYLTSPIRNIIDALASIKEASLSLKRIDEINIYEQKEGLKINSINDIEFVDLNYSHNEINDNLKNINLKINKGEKIAITGVSGSGKSTLLKLIKKYYISKDNSLYINGINLNSIDNDSLNKKVTYISQQELLFTDTLYNNIKLNRTISDDVINEVIKMCNIDSIIKNNNLGINMLIEENGFNLSGGERQRIVTARSLLNDFDVLIIDEGLNQVDINLEKKILDNILKKYHDKIIIYVTHRNDNLSLFDRFIKLQEGKIIKDEQTNRKI